jgi:hypothetical protein
MTHERPREARSMVAFGPFDLAREIFLVDGTVHVARPGPFAHTEPGQP